MKFDELVNNIPRLQQMELGGLSAQFRLAPETRQPYDILQIQQIEHRKAAVLVLLFPDSQLNMRFVITKRADYKGVHSNQISFTGGKFEESDVNLQQTAIRETYEEIGILVSENQILRPLTEIYIPPSQFLVYPYVAILNKTPNFKPNYEVHSVLTPLLTDLLDFKITNIDYTVSSSNTIKVPGFRLENEFVWGATAMILSELQDLLYRCFNNN